MIIVSAISKDRVIGMVRHVDWTKAVLLVLRFELLATGIAGWCPVYWVCRVGT